MDENRFEEEIEIVNTIANFIFSKMNIGTEWSELDILDDVNVSKHKIQELGVKISIHNPELTATILEIANSIYFCYNPLGRVPDFFDAVIRMGADRVKTLIFALMLFSFGKSPDARMRAAKSASISVLSKMIAEEMNLNDDTIRKVEAGGLLSQLGESVFMKARELEMPVSDSIIQKYKTFLATVIIDKLHLDPFLKKAVDLSIMEFDEKSFSLVGIIKLAETLTEDSFKKYGKLVLISPMPDKDNIVARTPGDTISRLFFALGIEEYLEIREDPTLKQREATTRQRKEAKVRNITPGGKTKDSGNNR